VTVNPESAIDAFPMCGVMSDVAVVQRQLLLHSFQSRRNCRRTIFEIS
jgi:hypothetical protein